MKSIMNHKHIPNYPFISHLGNNNKNLKIAFKNIFASNTRHPIILTKPSDMKDSDKV